MLLDQIVGVAAPLYLAQCADHRHILVVHAIDASHAQAVHVQRVFDRRAPDAFVCHKSFPLLVHDMLPPVRVAARGPRSLQCHRAGDQRRDVDVGSGLVPAKSAAFADRPRDRVRHRRDQLGLGFVGQVPQRAGSQHVQYAAACLTHAVGGVHHHLHAA